MDEDIKEAKKIAAIVQDRLSYLEAKNSKLHAVPIKLYNQDLANIENYIKTLNNLNTSTNN
jgi:pyrimidine operon attenuation protein/uracil phosphoribosyltransferase